MTTIITSNEPREILDQIIADLRRSADARGHRTETDVAVASALHDFAARLAYPFTQTQAENAAERAMVTRFLNLRMQEGRHDHE